MGARKKTLILIIAGVVLVILIVVAMFMLAQVIDYESGITLESPARQYFLLQETELPAGTQLTMGDGGVIITLDGEQTSGDTTPIYYTDTEKRTMVLSCDMSWVDVRDGSEWQVPALSTVEVDSLGNVWITVDEEQVLAFGGFLTDNTSTYVFLEQTRLTVDGDEITLSPLSFYSGIYGMIRVYDYASNDLQVYDSESLAGVTRAELYNSSMNLDAGLLTAANETQKLLVASPNVLTKITEK